MTALMKLSGGASMSSREIAELVGSRHDSVKRTIETLVSKGVIEFPQSVEIPTATKPVAAFVFSGEQGKRDSIIVVAQLSPEFTARLVDRWQELEMDVSSFGRIYLDGRNRRQTEYVLDRELTETLVTGYSVALRLKVKQSIERLSARA